MCGLVARRVHGGDGDRAPGRSAGGSAEAGVGCSHRVGRPGVRHLAAGANRPGWRGPGAAGAERRPTTGPAGRRTAAGGRITGGLDGGGRHRAGPAARRIAPDGAARPSRRRARGRRHPAAPLRRTTADRGAAPCRPVARAPGAAPERAGPPGRCQSAVQRGAGGRPAHAAAGGWRALGFVRPAAGVQRPAAQPAQRHGHRGGQRHGGHRAAGRQGGRHR